MRRSIERGWIGKRQAIAAYAGVLFAVLGGVAWATGRPFVFPSLGPSAFVLAFERRGERTRPRRVVGGHAVGALAGFLAYALLAGGVTPTATPGALSVDGVRLAASGVASMVLTSWGMLATDAVHPPACATTLIVSLGLLSRPLEVGIILVSVLVLVGVPRLAVSVGVGGVSAADLSSTRPPDGAPNCVSGPPAPPT